MKHNTRRMIESDIVPPALGAILGLVLLWSARTQGGLRITPELKLALFFTGLVMLAIVVFDAWRADEMVRHRHYLATYVGFVGAGVVTLAGGFLQLMGWPELNWGFVFSVLMGLYLVTWTWAVYRRA